MITGYWEYDKKIDERWSLWVGDEKVIMAIRTKNHGMFITSRVDVKWPGKHAETLKRWATRLFEKSDAGVVERQPFEISEKVEGN